MSISTSHGQTVSPQPTYSMSSQNSSFVATHLLGQGYGTENSNFGPIYQHHHHSHVNSLTSSTGHHNTYSNPYEKYKMSTSPHHNSAPYAGHYQGFYGHPQMVRQSGCIDYIPR